MRKSKKAALEAQGWVVGSVDDFLELTPEESALVDLKLRLSDALRARRTKRGLSQQAVAKRLHSSQSRVAKMEAGEARSRSICSFVHWSVSGQQPPISPKPFRRRSVGKPPSAAELTDATGLRPIDRIAQQIPRTDRPSPYHWRPLPTACRRSRRRDN